MRPSRRVIAFLNWFARGLFTPVLSLLLLERGCTLETLPLLLGAASAATIVCEVPSGVAADIWGRKRTYLISVGLYCAAIAVLAAAHSVWVLLPALVLYGVARAFASGSLDALFVEECLRERGEAALSKATGQLSLYQILGLAVGALAGGLLPNWHSYLPHLLARLVLTVCTGVVCLLLVREERHERGTPTGGALRRYLAEAAGAVHAAPALLGLLLCYAASGALLSVIETFWQPNFVEISTISERPMLGMLPVLGFSACSLGNLAIRRLARGGEWEWGLCLLLRIALASTAVLLAVQGGAAGFLAAYGGMYLVVGGADVVEQTLLNRMAPDGQRAGLLSAGSLATQIGGLLFCGFASVTVGTVGFSGLYLCGAVVVLACAAGTALLRRRMG